MEQNNTNSSIAQRSPSFSSGTNYITERDVEVAIDDAHNACDNQGKESRECAAAWDAAEEMQAAVADRKTKEKSKSSLERYCEERPEASECLIYDV